MILCFQMSVGVVRHIGRISVQSLNENLANPSMSLLSDLATLKSAVRESMCGLLVTIQPLFYEKSVVRRAMHMADGVVALSPIEDSSDICAYISDAATASCLLHLRKEPGINLNTNSSSSAEKTGNSWHSTVVIPFI